MQIKIPPYPITHPLIQDLAAGLRQVFPAREVLALYLGGSLAIGGFNPETSDLDFVVITRTEPAGQALGRLREMHARIWERNLNRLYRKCEGVYLSAHQAKHPADWIKAAILERNGNFAIKDCGPGLVIDLWKVRKGGFVVYGGDPEELIGPISTSEMIASKVAIFHSWWEPRLETHEPMSAGFQVYAAQTMARILYGVYQHDEVSKRASCDWLVSNFPQFEPLLDAVVDWRPALPFEHEDEVYELMAFVRDRIVN